MWSSGDTLHSHDGKTRNDVLPHSHDPYASVATEIEEVTKVREGSGRGKKGRGCRRGWWKAGWRVR